VFLDPTKLLVILIVALVVLGPDKLPTVARQMGAAWGELRKLRERLETEVRGTFPDLPSSHEMVQAVRSPLAFLDQLADAHERDQKKSGAAPENGSEPDMAMQPSKPVAPSASNDGGEPSAPASPPSPTDDGAVTDERLSAAITPGASPARAPRPVVRTRPWRGSASGESGSIPDDPSMN
jgi:TatA/E family protein of Tat protein translocase